MNKQCDYCKKILEGTSERKRFCGDLCRASWWQRHKKEQVKEDWEKEMDKILNNPHFKEMKRRLWENLIVTGVPKVNIHDLTAEQPKSNYTVNIPAPKTNKPTNTTTNKIEGSDGAVIDKSEIESQIRLLRQAEESCAKTPLGMKAKSAYQKQREELEKKLK